MLRWVWLSGLIIALDQLTKQWAQAMLLAYQPVPVLPSFNLTLMYNTGAAFSLLGNASGWQRWFLLAVALAISAVLVLWLTRLEHHQRWPAAALALILGGALGNVIDRIWHGHVIDFIQIYYQNWAWPTFNVADSAISVGVAIWIIDSLFGARRTRHSIDST